MNIFVLDVDPKLAAQYHCDKHASKMVLETAQIMSTVHHLHGMEKTPYRPTHKHHPCVVWAAECTGNFLWLAQLGLALAEEFTFRRGKVHKSTDVIVELGKPPRKMKTRSPYARSLGTRTPFVMAMPDDYKRDDAVQAYRDYYLYAKKDIATWAWGREPPPWWPKRTGLDAMVEAVNKEKA